ncbi:MAG: hypothetical protein ABIQ89_00855 [Candidatus Saccharimonadales bacterium]
MNPAGATELSQRLRQGKYKLQHELVPMPVEGDDNPYVTIVTAVDVSPATVLNALYWASMLHDETNSRELQDPDDPELLLIAASPGSLTFEDLASVPEE